MRFALVFALIAVGWTIYRRLPKGDSSMWFGASTQSSATVLHIVLRHESNDIKEAVESTVQLYSIDITAAQREYVSEPRAGQRFSEFLTQRMGKRQPITTKLDKQGKATVSVPPGRWWLHATLPGTEEITWRLPINVSGREHTVELTLENAYTRAKQF